MRLTIILIIGGLIIGLFMGCSVMSPQIKSDALPQIPFPELIRNAQKYKGDTIIVGGYVISVENKSNHTRIEAVQSPLGIGEKPKAKDLSQGRLILLYPGFIDPEVYTKDRRITAGGNIAGSSATVQKAPYPFLQLDVVEIHLWPVPPPVKDSCWYDDCYDYPWWRHPYGWRHRHW